MRHFLRPILKSSIVRIAFLFGVNFGLLLTPVASKEQAKDSNDELTCFNSDKNHADGIAACTRLIAAGGDAQQLSDAYLNRGKAHYLSGDYADARQDFSDAVNVKPNFVQAYQNRSFAEVKLSDFPGALADLNKAIELSSNSADLYVMRGVVLTSMGEFERAILDFNHAQQIDPKFVGAYYNRAYVLQRKRDKNGAIADYATVIKLTPAASRGYIGRASVLLDMAKFAAAITDLNEAIRIDPKNFEAFSVRGEAQRLNGDLGRALGDANEAVRLAPNNDAVYRNRALIKRDQKDFDHALADLDEALLHNPNSDLAYAMRGEIWAMKGDLDQSLADLDKSIALNPRSPVALSLRGDTLRLKGEFAPAIRDYEAANHYVSDYLAAYTGRGLTREAQGDLEGAITEFTKALSLPADVDAERARPARALAQVHLANVRDQLAAIDRKKKENLAAQAEESTAQRKAAEAEIQAAATKKAIEEAETRIKAERARIAAIENDLQKKAEALDAERKKAAIPVLEPIPDQGRRVALVIGNSNYTAVPQLYNPKGDAETVADGLKAVGFDSVKLVQDLSFSQMRKVLRDFQQEADNADWAMIYYAGHGIEVGGKNYLIPVDAHLASDRDVEDEAVSLKYVLEKIQGARRLHLVVLDACRDNPFEAVMRRQTAMRSVSRGLAPYEPQLANEIVLYSAKDGEQALDGQAGHSPFATAFVARIAMPRTEINRTFRLITSDVERVTKNVQQPWQYGSTRGEDDFYFNPK